MTVTTSKITAWAILFAFIFSFISSPVQAQQLLSTAVQEDQNPAVSPDNSGNPDLQSHCADGGCDSPQQSESPLSAANALPSRQENLQSIFDGLKAILPATYTADIVNEGGVDKLKINYTGTKAQTAGTLTSLTVNLDSGADNKVSANMNTLTVQYKGITVQANDTDMLLSSLAQAIESGIARNSGAGAAAETALVEASDLYEIFALSQLTVTSAKTTGTTTSTRTIVFKAEAVDYTSVRVGDMPTQTKLKSANITASMNYILSLQELLGRDNYRVSATTKSGEIIQVRITSLDPSSAIDTIQQINFAIKGGNLEKTPPFSVFVKSASGLTALSAMASDMLRDAALLIASDRSPEGMQHLLGSSIKRLPAATDKNTIALLIYEKDGQNYEVKYSTVKKDWIVENTTHKAEITDYVMTFLRNHLANPNLKFEILSISPQGYYEVKISSTVAKIPANTFASMSFKLEKTDSGIEMVSSSFAANYQGFKPASSDFHTALFHSFGIAEAGQSPDALSGIAAFEDKLKAISRVSVLKNYDIKVNRFSFSLNNRDYEASHARGSTPPVGVEDQTDLRHIIPFEASLKKIFPGTIITREVYPNGEYKFSITDTTTKAYEVKTLDFYVRVAYDSNNIGTVQEIPNSLFLSYNGIYGGGLLNHAAAQALRDGIEQVSQKTALLDILTALSTAKVEFYDRNNSTVTVLFSGKRYQMKPLSQNTDVVQVFEVKNPAFALWKTIDTVLNPMLSAASPALQAEIQALKTEVLKTGGNILSSMDQAGSVYIQFFSNANGTFTTIKIENDPRTNQKTLLLSHNTLSELTSQQAQLYLENMATDKATSPLAADIKNMLTLNPMGVITLERINGLSILSGTYKSKPFSAVVYANQTLRIFAAAKAPTTMPTIAAGSADAKKTFVVLEKYLGGLSASDLAQIESLRTQIYSTPATVKSMQVSKGADGTYQITWLQDRQGTAQTLTLSNTAAGSKTFAGITLSPAQPLVSGTFQNTLPVVEDYLKNFGTTFFDVNTNKATTLAAILTKLKNANATNEITVEITDTGILFKRPNSVVTLGYTISISFTGAVRAWAGQIS